MFCPRQQRRWFHRIGAQNVEGDDKVDTSRAVGAPDSVNTNTEESVGQQGQAPSGSANRQLLPMYIPSFRAHGALPEGGSDDWYPQTPQAPGASPNLSPDDRAQDSSRDSDILELIPVAGG
jgi:hypothetical protein